MRDALLARGKERDGVCRSEGSLQDVEVDGTVLGEEGDGEEAKVDEDLSECVAEDGEAARRRGETESASVVSRERNS